MRTNSQRWWSQPWNDSFGDYENANESFSGRKFYLSIGSTLYTLGSEEEFGFYPANGWMKIHLLYLKNTVQCCGGGVES